MKKEVTEEYSMFPFKKYTYTCVRYSIRKDIC